MTVKELIERLEKYDENATVEIYTNDEYLHTAKDVWQPKRDKLNNENIVIITNY